jgi:hypothetical protein
VLFVGIARVDVEDEKDLHVIVPPSP